VTNSEAIALAEWLAEVGLPKGVFNVVQGGKEAVDALLEQAALLASKMLNPKSFKNAPVSARSKNSSSTGRLVFLGEVLAA
jgi:Aldehyde dehydrogenase family